MLASSPVGGLLHTSLLPGSTLGRLGSQAVPRPHRFPESVVLASTPDGEADDLMAEFRALQKKGGPKESKNSPRAQAKRKRSSLALQDDQVPEAQQPAQELADLKEAPFFAWGQLEDDEFLSRIGKVYGASLVFPSLPIALVTYPLDEQPIQALLSANVGSLAFIILLMLRLYGGWSYIGNRLQEEVGYYEETGWYDGFMSRKPEEIKARDQLLYKDQVAPTVARLQKFGAAAAGLFVGCTVLLNVAAPDDPYAQFETGYLAALQADDQVAAKEAERAKKRGNKPTYCDSRYYRTVAGGGGC